jgi:uncharacterized repeat protein (TIGR02059 family)
VFPVTKPGAATVPGVMNQIELTVTNSALPAGISTAALSFTGLPDGASVMNGDGEVVTAGVAGFSGSETFTVTLPEAVDVSQTLWVTVTGKDADGGEIGHNVQAIDLTYEMLTFATANQNMWGPFSGYIGFHEYVPFLGDAPIVWNANTGEWEEDATADYWRSGQFSVVDIDVDTEKIMEAASAAATTVLDAAKTAFDATAFVIDDAVQTAYDFALGEFQKAEDAYNFVARTVDDSVRENFEAAKVVYDNAVGQYNAASYAFNWVATGLHDAAWARWEGYSNWYNSLDGWGQFWNAAGNAVEWGFWVAADELYKVAEDLWWLADQAFNVVDTGAKAVYDVALAAYNLAASAVDEGAQGLFDLAWNELAEAETLYNNTKQAVYEGALALYEGARSGVLDILDQVGGRVDFDSALRVDAEVFAQAGLQVDFELDMGSVDSSVDYRLTSTTQYNQTTDMLDITPMMTNLTTGDSVAFETISPNAKAYIALLYDVGADFDVFMDGNLVIDGLTIYDLLPTTVQFPLSTASFADDLGVISGGNIDVGELVLLDLDTTKLEPFDIPFIEDLTKDMLTIQLAIPTLETEGTADTYVPMTTNLFDNLLGPRGTFEEQIGPLPYASIDFSEISGTFFNMLNAKFDFSEEFMEQYGLDSLDGKTLEETVEDIATGLMANIWDVLSGQSEGVPIFVLDMTDETSSSLLHLNLFPDSVIADTTGVDTGSLGFYAAYGESEPVVKITLDVDATYVFIVKEVAKAVAAAVSSGSTTALNGVIDALPSPYNIEFGIEQMLEIAELPQETIDQVTSWINLGFSFEAVDFDISNELNFSQKFTLAIDDMSYLATLESGSQYAFTANGSGALQIENASSHDANGDGLVEYRLDMVPTAMFSNDTELGMGMSYQLDFLQGGFEAGMKLPLNTLLGIENADWLNIEIPFSNGMDISMGPLLRVQGDYDTFDVDVFESRFPIDLGKLSVDNSFSVPADTTPPVFVSAATSTDGTTVILTYDEALDATNIAETSAFAVSVGANNIAVTSVAVVGSTVELTLTTAITNGQAVTVSYTDPTLNNDELAIQNAAGNDAANLAATTATNLTAASPPSGGDDTGNDDTDDEDTNGGLLVQETNRDGSVTTRWTIAPPSSSGPSNQIPSFPLAADTNGGPLVQVGLPGGFGFSASGVSGEGLGLREQLLQAAASQSTDEEAQGFLADSIDRIVTTAGASDSTEPMVVRAITFTAPISDLSGQPIVISGAASGEGPLVALIIDVSNLPSGTVLQFDNVEFAIIIGAAKIKGGEGSNFVIGDDAAQYIVLGVDDDVLRGGGGDDTIGSGSGNDQLFGDDGNDTLFVGSGHNLLHGGRDSDIVTYEGNMDRYVITREHGKTIVTSLDDPDKVDTLINVELIRFNNQDYQVENSNELSLIATLYQQVLGRQGEIDGFQYWAEDAAAGASLGSIAMGFLRSVEKASAEGRDFESFSAEDQIESLYNNFLGRASEDAGKDYWLDELNSGIAIEDIASGFVYSIELAGIQMNPTDWAFFV